VAVVASHWPFQWLKKVTSSCWRAVGRADPGICCDTSRRPVKKCCRLCDIVAEVIIVEEAGIELMTGSVGVKLRISIGILHTVRPVIPIIIAFIQWLHWWSRYCYCWPFASFLTFAYAHWVTLRCPSVHLISSTLFLGIWGDPLFVHFTFCDVAICWPVSFIDLLRYSVRYLIVFYLQWYGGLLPSWLMTLGDYLRVRRWLTWHLLFSCCGNLWPGLTDYLAWHLRTLRWHLFPVFPMISRYCVIYWCCCGCIYFVIYFVRYSPLIIVSFGGIGGTFAAGVHRRPRWLASHCRPSHFTRLMTDWPSVLYWLASCVSTGVCIVLVAGGKWTAWKARVINQVINDEISQPASPKPN